MSGKQVIAEVAADNSGDRDLTLEVSGTGVTFDDLDDVQTARQNYVEEKTGDKPKEEKTAEKKEAKPEKTAEQVKSDAKEEADKNVDPTMAPIPEVAEARMIKAVHGEDGLDIPHNAAIPVKIEGEDTPVELQELINNYSGKTAWDKRFSELDSERRAYLNDKDGLMGKLGKFKELITGETPQDGLVYLVDMLGGNGDNFYRSLRESMLPQMEEYLEMSPEERAIYDANQEREFLRKRNESLEEKIKLEQSEKELVAKIDQLRESHGVSEVDFATGYDELKEMGAHEQTEITPDLVIDYIKAQPFVDKATEILAGVDEELVQDPDNITMVASMMMKEGFSEGDVRAELEEEFGIQNKAKILSKKTSQPVASRQEVEANKTTKLEMFSDLEDY